MPRLLKGLRQRGKSFFYRVRAGGKEQTIGLGKDRDGAIIRALEIERRIKAGLPPVEERKPVFSVEDAVKDWLKNHVDRHRRGAFAGQTRSRCERVLLPFMGRMRLEDVTAGTLFAYSNHVAGLTWGTDSRNARRPKKGRRAKADKISPTTVRMYLGDLRAVLNHALTLQAIDHSPVPRRWLPKMEERAPDVLSVEEQAELRALPGDYGLALRILLGTGIRWGELVRAQAKDIQAGKLVITQSKSGKPRRVPLPPDLLAECQGRVGRLVRFKDACTFNKRVRDISKIDRFHSHLCRHTYATEWREAGGSLAALQAVLGHGSITVTERYGTIGDDLVEREAQRLVEYRAHGGAR